MRQFVIFLAALFRLVQIFYHLHLIRISREPFSRRIRPPLVIKALLDMKGDAIATAEPLTMGMLERLEGIVKVRGRLKAQAQHNCPSSPLYLPCISPISPLYLPRCATSSSST